MLPPACECSAANTLYRVHHRQLTIEPGRTGGLAARSRGAAAACARHVSTEDIQRSANRGRLAPTPGQLALAHPTELRHGSTKPPVLIPTHGPPNTITDTGAQPPGPHRVHADKDMMVRQPSGPCRWCMHSIEGTPPLSHPLAHLTWPGSHPRGTLTSLPKANSRQIDAESAVSPRSSIMSDAAETSHLHAMWIDTAFTSVMGCPCSPVATGVPPRAPARPARRTVAGA